MAIDAALDEFEPYEDPIDFSGIVSRPVAALCFAEVEWLDAIPRGSERSRLFKRALCALNDAADVTGSPPVVKAQRW